MYSQKDIEGVIHITWDVFKAGDRKLGVACANTKFVVVLSGSSKAVRLSYDFAVRRYLCAMYPAKQRTSFNTIYKNII